MALKSGGVRTHLDPHTARKWGGQDPHRIAATGWLVGWFVLFFFLSSLLPGFFLLHLFQSFTHSYNHLCQPGDCPRLRFDSTVRLITGTNRCDHITPVLRKLHLWPVRQRVEFKLAVFVYKSLHGLTAPYLTDDCQLVANSGRRRLRSADVDTCIVPRTNTRLGDRSFAVAGPRFWNTLPAELRQPHIELVTFRRWLLKTHLFKCDPGA